MAKPVNPMLAAFEAKIRQEMTLEFAQKLVEFNAQKEAEFDQRLGRNTEINLIAMLIAGNDLGILFQFVHGIFCQILPGQRLESGADGEQGSQHQQYRREEGAAER